MGNLCCGFTSCLSLAQGSPTRTVSPGNAFVNVHMNLVEERGENRVEENLREERGEVNARGESADRSSQETVMVGDADDAASLV